MTETIDDYYCKLINQLLFANSQHDVRSIIYVVIKQLKQQKEPPYVIKRFLDKTIQSLEEFNPHDYNSRQWANVKAGKIELKNFKTAIPQMAN